MADPLTIKTSTRTINGITTRIEVNVETGAATLYQERALGRTVLATGSAIGNKWTVTNEFASLYSTRVGSTLTLAQAQNAFSKDFQNLSNNDRASLINTWSPDNTRTYLATKAKVPGIIDPKTKLKTGQTAQTQATAPPAGTPGSQPPLDPDPGANPGSTIPDLSGVTLTPEQVQSQQFSGGSPAILVYPLDHGQSGFDFLQVRALEYVPGIGDLNAIPTNGITPVQQRIPKTNQIGPTVCLPMTQGISESNSIGWGSDELNPVQAAFGNAAMTTIQNSGFGPNGIDLTQVQKNIQNIGNAAVNIANSSGMSKFIAAYFAGQAVQANLLGRAGIVINPNMELLFQGPKLRSFRYSFKFTPRSGEEAEEIRRIIRFFKKTSAPKRPSGSLFLGVPSVYELKYIYNEQIGGTREHPFLNKLKLCALSSFNINYTPDGSYMTYNTGENGKGEGSMTSYAVDMQFDELEPIYNEDIDSSLEASTMGF